MGVSTKTVELMPSRGCQVVASAHVGVAALVCAWMVTIGDPFRRTANRTLGAHDTARNSAARRFYPGGEFLLSRQWAQDFVYFTAITGQRYW